MARDLRLDEVVDHFTLVGDEVDQLRNKAGSTRLGFALTLKFLLWRGRFPQRRHELADDAVQHMARQVDVAATEIESYDFSGRSAQRHRTEIRRYTGFRECSVADAEALASWLAGHVAEEERGEEGVRDRLLARCRGELIEPPSADRVTEIVRSALRQAEQTLVARVAARIDPGVIGRLEALVDVEEDADDDHQDVLATIKSDPGNVSLDSLLAELAKLTAVRAVGLPASLFSDVAPKVVAGWRARATVESPSHLRDHPQPIRLVLLSALLFEREGEVTDTLVELLISTVHRIDARAEKKVVKEFVKDFRRVTGKNTMLRQIAEAALEAPDETVRQVIYPVVGGETTLRDLVAEYRAGGTEYQRNKRREFKSSYTNHYRRGLIKLLGVLEFRSNNTAHRPVIEALSLIVRHAGTSAQFYPPEETVVLDGVVRPDWEDLLVEIDSRGRKRIVATPPAGTSPSTAPAPWPSSWPTPPSPPATPASGARAPPPWHPTQPTSAPTTRTCSPSGTPATAGGVFSSIGTSSASRWSCTPNSSAAPPPTWRPWSKAPSATAPRCNLKATTSTRTASPRSASPSPRCWTSTSYRASNGSTRSSSTAPTRKSSLG